MRLAMLLALLGAAWTTTASAEEGARDPCATRVALLEKRLAALQLRLQGLEHELASRPRPEVAPAEGWRDAAAWRRLRNEMSQADVLRILGAPGRVTTYYGFQRWEYPDALGQRVDFDESGRLIAWGALAR
jgi:hypothetical protein